MSLVGIPGFSSGSDLFGPSQALAYRTAGQLSEFKGTEKVRWRSDRVSFVLHSDSAPSAVSGGVADVMLEAMRQWNEPLCSSLELQPSGVTRNDARPGDGVNTIQWVRNWADRGFSSDAPATTDVQYERVEGEDWVITEADIYLDAAVQWRLRASADATDTEFDLLSVLTHELGHAAGLLHPCEPGGRDNSPNCSSKEGWDDTTMYPLYSPDQATLERDDERGVCFLYQQDTCEQLGCNKGYECTDQGCQPLCGSRVCEVGEQCVDDECVTPCVGIECTNPACEIDDDCPDDLRCNGKHCVPGLGSLGDPCATPRDCNSQACSKRGVCLSKCEKSIDCNPECDAARSAAHAKAKQAAEAAGEKFDADDVPAPPECEDYLACRSGLDGSRVCETPLAALGDPCTESNECLGDQCVADVLDSPVCTRRCGEGQPDCPDTWTCDLVQGRAVCVPPFSSDGKCSISLHTPSPPTQPRTQTHRFGHSWYTAVLTLLGLLLARRRRTERTRS